MKIKTCKECNGKCCRYIVIEIATPKSKEDLEELKWYIAHENVEVFVDKEGGWNVEFITPCKYLGKDNRCKIYKKRPDICREYSNKECEMNFNYVDKFRFKDIEEINKYIKEVFNKNK
jgi:Fe-S-cluster containining protein